MFLRRVPVFKIISILLQLKAESQCNELFWWVTIYFNQRRQWQPTPALLPGKIPWTEEPGRLWSMGSQESDTTEWLHFHFSLSCIGEGNGNPLHCSCLESPIDGGAWWAAVCGVAQSRTRLKRLSSSKFRKFSGGHKTGKGQFSFQSQRKAMPKNAQTTSKLHSSHMLVKWCLKFSKPGFSNTWTMNFQMLKLVLEKAKEPEIKLPTSAGWSKKQESSRKTSISWLCQSLWLCASQ